MVIVLVRHGETALNAARILQPADTPLSERGREQAAAVARRLAAAPVAALLSSDLPRAWQTAEAIAAACGAVPVGRPWLRERNFGALRGRAYDALGFDPLAQAEAPPGGESAADFAARVGQALAALAEEAAGLRGDLVVVTHGLVIRGLLASLPGVPTATLGALHLGNTSVSIVDAHPPHTVQLLNCTRHLAGGAADDRRALVGG